MREHLVALLTMSGYEVAAAADGYVAGLEAIRAEAPDIAVVDNRLPDGRGVDLAAALKEEAPGVGVIIHSGAITADETAHALRCGALEVVTKDIRARGLVDALRRHAGPSRSSPTRRVRRDAR